MLSGYIEFSIAAFINYSDTNMSWSYFGTTVSNSSLVFYTVLLVAFPYGLWFLLYKNFDRIATGGDLEKYQQYLGKFNLKFRLKEEIWVVAIFIIRRLVLTFTLTSIHRGELQIFVFLAISMGKLCFVLGFRPYADRNHYLLDVFNELCIW